MNPKLIAIGLAAGRQIAKNNPINDVTGCVDSQACGVIDGIFGGGSKPQEIHTGKKKTDSWWGEDKEEEDENKEWGW